MTLRGTGPVRARPRLFHFLTVPYNTRYLNTLMDKVQPWPFIANKQFVQNRGFNFKWYFYVYQVDGSSTRKQP